jgi:hypothetical protein
MAGQEEFLDHSKRINEVIYYIAASDIRLRHAFPRHIEMKKWPFAGLKIGSTRAAVKI